MSKPTDAAAPAKPAQRKRAGRRPKGDQDVSRDTMVACAIRIARNESLGEVSMVRIGKELSVAAGMVHYHMGSRDELISTVINAAFKERMQLLPTLTGDWRQDLENIAFASLDAYSRWPGLATYILTENKFRLFQRVKPGEVDYGLAYFDHIGKVLMQAGMPGPFAAMAYHILMLFVLVMAAEKENRQSPQTHSDFITGYMSRIGADDYLGAAYLAAPFAAIDSPKTFETGTSILLDGFERWRTDAMNCQTLA
ncbi:TetR/AcrR family transcriptional regulator [Pseudomonas sp. NY15364]|uniref:TetR/AcrR family transcriptional regulator n=1 Tax=Pseudomonas sp. NY15364 TaxID=3400353 RepID=UPI003A8A42FE